MTVPRVLMYTKGTGSGHLTRINAVYKGFVRAGIACEFFASADRSKYRDFLAPAIQLCEKANLPTDLDIFICDWRSDEFTNGLPRELAKTWIGLRRLGTMKVTFPSYYHVIAIEPGVKADACIWPVIATWPDELLTRAQLHELLGLDSCVKISLMCENGAYPKHVAAIFGQQVPDGIHAVRSSNSPYADGLRTINYYPVAETFAAADYLVIGAGYNSVHEALSYANLDTTSIIRVGGDDQALRLVKMPRWERGRGSRADELAAHIMDLHSRQHNSNLRT